MVRPNQIIESDLVDNTLTFIIFAQTESMAARRTLLINFPTKAINLSTKEPISTDAVLSVVRMTGGLVNKYAVTVDIDRL